MSLPASSNPHAVAPHRMEAVYRELLTPHKWGPVLIGPHGDRVDNPKVFLAGGRWFMTYNLVEGAGGYEGWLATSENLVEWTPLGRILSKGSGSWDDGSVGLYLGLQDLDLDTAWKLNTHDGRYWLSYLGGTAPGFEVPPLNLGLASTDDPTRPQEWTRLPGNPILSTTDPDVGWWEDRIQFASHLVRDEARTLGHPFVLVYNAKGHRDNAERIGLAVSDDLIHWQRPQPDPIVSFAPDHRITGDPQLLKIGDLYVLLFWIHGTTTNDHESFACSYDLVHWTHWHGTGLTPGLERWEGCTAAHKPWVFRKDGIVYHFFNYTHVIDGKPYGGIGLSTSAFIGKSYQLEEMQIVDANRSHLVVPAMDCASYQAVHFRSEQEGDYICFSLPVPEAGKYRLKVACLTGPDAGSYRLKLNGETLPGILEAHAAVPGQCTLDVGNVTIAEPGAQSITFEATARPGRGLLLDKIDLLKA